MGVVRNIYDGLQNLVTGLGTRADARMARSYASLMLGPQQIEEAYEASPSLRKAIAIPATDRVRAWRDWQADDDQIELLEAEERRLQIQAKCKQGEILRGLGGGAMILVAAGDHAMPINVTGKGGLIAANMVSRHHLSGEDWDDDIASPTYGAPKYWTISGSRNCTRIHPSRVVCFRGDPLPSAYNGSQEDRFWGRGRAPSLIESAQNLDEALSTFAAMIKDSLNVDIGVTKLLEMVATPEGEARLNKRLSIMMQGSSVFHGKLYDLGDETGKGGEKLDRHQVDWAGIDATIRVYAEAFCAAADIPFTRFWGTSAKGLNATGEGDERDWNKMVETGQNLETRPCLDQIDVALIPSALGSRPPEIWWKFGALSIPTENEEATRFKTWTEAMDKVAMSGAIPEVAFNETYQNGLRENGWTPGIDAALDKIPEAERYGGAVDPDEGDDTDPSELQATKDGGGPHTDRPFADARRRSKGQRLARNARASGFDPTQPRDRFGRWVPTGRRNYIDAAAKGTTGAGQLSIGKVGDKVKAAAAAKGILLKGDDIALDASMIRHTVIRHGRERGGQRSVTAADIASAHGILNRATQFKLDRHAYNGSQRFVALTKLKGERIFTVFEVRKKAVSLVTMWKRK